MTASPAPLPIPDPAAPDTTPREVEILDSIRHVFAEKGFDGASMQDLARAAGMSVGNFYRYFPSKAAMVETMVLHDLKEVERQFAIIATAADPMEALRNALHDRLRNHHALCEDAPLWAEVTAAALRKPDLAGIVARMEAEITQYILKSFALAQGRGLEEVAADFTDHARLVVMLVKAVATEGGLHPGHMAGTAALAQRQIDRLLDEIAARPPQETPR